MKYFVPTLITISALNAAGIDADLDMGAHKVTASKINTNTLDQATTPGGDITVNGKIALATGKGVESDATIQGGTVTSTGGVNGTDALTSPAPSAGTRYKKIPCLYNNNGYDVISAVPARLPGVPRVYFPVGGTVNVGIRAMSGATGHIKIYKNGTAVGTDRLTSAAFNAWTESISVSAGDYLEIYAITTAGNYTVGSWSFGVTDIRSLSGIYSDAPAAGHI